MTREETELKLVTYNTESERDNVQKNDQSSIPSIKYIGFNSTNKVYECYDGTSWSLLNGSKVYADATARDAAITSPVAGQMICNTALKATQTYTGSVWVTAGNENQFDVKSFGAVGDGANDDTEAIQTALTEVAVLGGTIHFSSGTYRTTDNLYWHGNVSISGPRSAILLLDAVPTRTDYWILGGIKDYGATSGNGGYDNLSGSLRGITIATSAQVTGPIRILNCMRFDGLTIQDVLFDVEDSGTVAVGPIGFYNNAPYCAGYIRENLLISGMQIKADQDLTGSEGIGISSVTNGVIIGNRIYGVGDDVIALHSCFNIAVIGNICESQDGRIVSSSTSGWQFIGNHVTRLGSTGSGASIMCNKPTIGDGPAPCDGIISGNVIVHNSALGSVAYGIRTVAGRRIAITGNVISDTSGNGYGISIEGKAGLKADNGIDDWVDPEGIDGGPIAYARNITCTGNVITGTSGGARTVRSIYCDPNGSIIANNNWDQQDGILTIAAGGVNMWKEYHTIAAETGTTDNLDGISGFPHIGARLVIKADTGDTITVRNGASNIYCGITGGNVVLSGNVTMNLIYTEDGWFEL